MVDVSIVIPVYNNFSLTKTCIDSIKNAQLKTNYEIIIADDGSTDETVNIENYYENVRLIRTKNNSGFLLNVKNAIPYAKSNYILLMNNDMIAKPHFLDYLYKTITQNTEIGIAGAMILNKDGSVQEVGGTIFDDGTHLWNHTGETYVQTSKLYDVDYCSGCGIMFSKQDWEKLGGFDERFIPAYYEDTDFCFQIKYNLNKRVVCQPKAQIYHLSGQTYQTKISDIMRKNRKKFLEKWRDKLVKNREIYTRKSFFKKLYLVYNNRSIRHQIITLFSYKILK